MTRALCVHALALGLLAPACAATVDNTARDAAVDARPPADVPVTPGDVPVSPADVPVSPADVPVTPADVPVTPADVPAGPCVWRAGAAVVLPATTSATPHRTLLDVRPAEGGAWALTRDDAGTNRAEDLALERIDADGRRRAAVRLPAGLSLTTASLAVDEALGRRAVLAESRSATTEGCALIVLDALGTPAAPRAITFPNGGFSLAGCRDLLPNAAGFTFLAEQVRALWGVSVVQLAPDGQTPAQMAPAVYDGFPEVPFGRFALPDRGFAFVWSGPTRAQPGMSSLQLRRFDEGGAQGATAQAVTETSGVIRERVVLATADGLLALWEEAPGESSPYRVHTRALAGDGAPRGEVRALTELGFYQGGLAATRAGGDVLALGVTGSGVLRPVALPLGPDGAPRGATVPLPMPPGASRVEHARIVATPQGALAVFATDPERYPNQLVAVPLSCAP